MVNLDGGDVPLMANHCTAFNDRFMMFFLLFSLKNNVFVFIPKPYIPNFATKS